MVDILLATYNGEEYITDLIESILSQSNSSWRMLVSDDGSSDSTVKILKTYQQRYPEKIEIIQSDPHGSAKSNFFFLLEQSTSELVRFCDQDDIWKKDKIEVFLDRYYHLSVNGPVLLFSDMEVVDENGKELQSSFFKYSHLDPARIGFNELLALNCIAGCSMMLNSSLRTVILDSNRDAFSAALMHDSWCALVAAAFGHIEYINQPLVLYRQHGTNTVGAKEYFSTILYSMEHYSARKDVLKKSCCQAQAFLDSYGAKLDEDNFEVVRAYSCLSQKTLINKWKTLTKYKLWKHGLARKLDQLFNY